MEYLFEPPVPPSVAVDGQSFRFPVHRIYCVGRNYRAHAQEMGSDPDREPPFFFSKPADAIVTDQRSVPFPSRCANLHHEVELVVAIGCGGKSISVADANNYIYGYAVGIDLTRRDLQAAAREKSQPWDSAKGFDHSAPVGALRSVGDYGHPGSGTISLSVNGTVRQDADIAELIWSVPEVISELSSLFELKAGDLIFTGTPAGVSALQTGDRLEAWIEGLPRLTAVID